MAKKATKKKVVNKSKSKKVVKKYEPVTVFVEQPDDLFSQHQYDVSKSIILAIDYAVKNNLKKVDFAKVIVHHQVEITMELNMAEYEDTLDKNIKIMEKFEEYEVCAFATKLKQKIKLLESKSKKPLFTEKKKKSSWEIESW